MFKSFVVLCLVVALPLASRSADREWGDLTGVFTFDGEPPETKTLKVDEDQAAFALPVPDESLLVSAENRGIANILVYLLPAEGQVLRVHPSYEESADAKVELSMKDGRFQPHVLLIRTTQTMVQRNQDKVGHNASIQFFDNLPR